MSCHGLIAHFFLMLRERNRSEKAICCVVPTIWHSGKGTTTEPVQRSVVTKGLGAGREKQVKYRGFKKYIFVYLAALGLSCDTRDLVPWPGIEPGPHALGVWSPSHWDHRGLFFLIEICWFTVLVSDVQQRKYIYTHFFFRFISI